MDTKLKNNKKGYITLTIVLVLLLIMSISIVSYYPRIKEIVSNVGRIILNDEYFFQRSLYEGSYALYKDLVELESGNEVSADEVFIKEIKSEQNTSQYNDVRQNINYEVNRWANKFEENYKNLDYYMLKKDSNKVVSNTNNKLGLLLADSIDAKQKEELENNYSFYMVVNFDEFGKVNIVKSKGIKEDTKSTFINFDKNSIFQLPSNLEVNGLKNVSVVYGIPEDLRFKDDISRYTNNSDKYAYENVTLTIGLIAYGIALIIGLFASLKYLISIKLINKIVNLPFEILVFIISVITACIALSPDIVYSTINREWLINAFNELGFSTSFVNPVLDIGNVLYWFILLFAAFIAVLVIKKIFTRGLINYIKENSLVGRVIKFILKILKCVYRELINVDLNNKSNKIVLKIVSINFIILSFMCVIWFFGIGAALIYSIVLFFVLKKYFEDIKGKYQILLKATNKIAEGNLDVTIEENLGVFEPVKDELEKIQKGFKNAVEEEVKSQRMKTELISNVSHDLKTPLTSIITYIDLLKDENISKEDREKYLSTLERKSQRLKNLIEDLFEVSKATSKNIKLDIVNVDIVSLMKQTHLELSDKIEESSLKFKWNLPEHKVIVPLDSQKTYRIFENLLINVVKYSMPNSRVFIDIVDDEKGVYVTLKNMSATEIDFTEEEIIERFARGDKSRNTEGSGLGLAIAKSFVELQGGSLKIEIDGDLFKVILKFNK
ncbi:MAG: sensor histidine kinase [Clostridium sp.]|uniref:sensor histidine kinase n=1 Tax=Clostridium sp. TaxID=1506 RepID=UPI00290DC615|nr:sensor histidine kinase [Clostridium sp.]MDU5111648.1 sensor histidine kinase [Clostridium sp.]